MRRCVIFGGGELKDIRFTQSLLREDDYIVCADRGYAYCAAMGRKPDLILGDFDSYNGKLPPGCEVLRYPSEKDDTDTMLAVKEAIRREFADILMLGMLGGRLDHTLANIQTIVYAEQHGASAGMVEEECRITPLGGGQGAEHEGAPERVAVLAESPDRPVPRDGHPVRASDPRKSHHDGHTDVS